jgi:hypothetical protein
MKGDFSRITFDPRHNYSQVLLQQGRVLLDADFNELAAISAYRVRQLARDTFGPHAGPVRADGTGDPGFFISLPDPGKPMLQAGAGRYYVDGLGVGLDAPLPLDPKTDLNLATGVMNLLYLDVWEQLVTWLDSDGLVEPALDGPDTGTRVQVKWQVRGLNVKDVKNPDKVDWGDWLNTNLRRWPRALNPAAPLTLPQMVAWTDPQASDDDTPCVADPAGGYRGLENQLYRVEIHNPGDSASGTAPTFKWSRENGSVAAPWVDTQGNDLIVEGIHDTARGFSAGQWVELTNLADQTAGVPGTMVQLVKVDGLRLTFDPATASPAAPGSPAGKDHPLVRRWDQREVRADKAAFRGGTVVLDEKRDYTLEAGIKIAFPPYKEGKKSVTTYHTGDYWLIPARPSIGDILWTRATDPNATGKDRFVPLEPAGIEHVYAPLALAQVDAAGKPTLAFKPLQKKYVPNVKDY